jgi:hypothetical protein
MAGLDMIPGTRGHILEIYIGGPSKRHQAFEITIEQRSATYLWDVTLTDGPVALRNPLQSPPHCDFAIQTKCQ